MYIMHYVLNDTNATSISSLDSHIPLHGLGDAQESVASDPNQLPPLNFAPSHIPSGPTSSDGPSALTEGLRRRTHPKSSQQGRGESSLGPGANLLQEIDQNDALRQRRVDSENIFYPFASRAEWELARWLGTRSLPQSEINEFLHLDWVSATLCCCYAIV